MSPARWKAGQERRALLAEQTRDLAARLERIGIGAMVQTDHVAISAVTGVVDDVEAFRAVKFLPLIAQRDRRPMLNALRYYQANTEDGEWMRLAVVTAGVVIPAGGPLKSIAATMKKNISRWASDADGTYGVHVLFRGVEFTRKRGDERLVGRDGEELPSLHERDPERFDSEAYYYHVHANVLYRPRPGIDKSMWRHFLRWSRMRLGNVAWKDCGKLRKPEEACKYPFKPTELGEMPDDELRWLYHSTFRQNDMQPMGRLKAFRASLEGNVKRDEDGNRVLDEQGQTIPERLKITMVRQKQGARMEIVRKREPDPRPDRDPARVDDLRPAVRENLVMTVTAPQARHTPWAEPVIMVAGYTKNPTQMAGAEGYARILQIIREARAAWDANGAPEPSIALATAEAWRNARCAEEAERVVAMAEQNRKGSRSEGADAFKVHTCRLTAQAPEGGAGRVASEEAQPPRPWKPRAVEFTDDGHAFDPGTGELISPVQQASGFPDTLRWLADHLPSTIHARADREVVRAAYYLEWKRQQWRDMAARKRGELPDDEERS